MYTHWAESWPVEPGFKFYDDLISIEGGGEEEATRMRNEIDALIRCKWMSVIFKI